MDNSKTHQWQYKLFLFEICKTAEEERSPISDTYGKAAIGAFIVRNGLNDSTKVNASWKTHPEAPNKWTLAQLQKLWNENAIQWTRDMVKYVIAHRSSVPRLLRQLISCKIQNVFHLVSHAVSNQNTAQRLNTSVTLLARHRRKSFLSYSDKKRQSRTWARCVLPWCFGLYLAFTH